MHFVAGLPTPCFYADFGVSYHERVTETLKYELKKSNSQKVFYAHSRLLLSYAKESKYADWEMETRLPNRF